MKQLVSLEDHTVVVTGAGQGIGRAISNLVIELGGNVVAVDVNSDALAAAVSAMPAERVLTAVGSVTNPELAAATVERAVARFGQVTGLVNNAGITRPALIEKMSLAQWTDVIDVHLTGAFLWTQAVGIHFVERAKRGMPLEVRASTGSVVNISSDAGRKGSVGQINYAAAKAGMLGMTMSAAREWGKYRIRANSLCFGVVETPMTEVVRGEKFRDGMLAQIPLGRWSSPEEVVETVCYLLSDAASYITGQHLGVNGGFHISV